VRCFFSSRVALAPISLTAVTAGRIHAAYTKTFVDSLASTPLPT
jgi:hypothetical protein